MIRVASLWALAGCSMVFVREGPPRRALPGDHVECTTSKTWPTIDIAIGGSTLVGSVLAATGELKNKHTNADGTITETEMSSAQKAWLSTGFAIYGLLAAYSAYWGWNAVDHCREVTAP